jgi:general secretion pathway protein G
MKELQNRTIRQRARRRRRREGMTLVEIMVVVIIMALIAAAVGFAVVPMIEQSKIDSTRIDARTIKGAASLYVARSGGCPTVGDLIDRGLLDADQRTTDGWENEFTIECRGRNIVVISGGPDGQIGTEDDIRSDQRPEEQD